MSSLYDRLGRRIAMVTGLHTETAKDDAEMLQVMTMRCSIYSIFYDFDGMFFPLFSDIKWCFRAWNIDTSFTFLKSKILKYDWLCKFTLVTSNRGYQMLTQIFICILQGCQLHERRALQSTLWLRDEGQGSGPCKYYKAHDYLRTWLDSRWHNFTVPDVNK